MRDLFGSHSFKYGTAARIARWKSLQMLIEMPFDLPLCLGDESQAGAVAERRRSRADEKGADIPERIEEARSCSQLPEPHLAPRQMVRLRTRTRQEHRSRTLRAGDERLSVVEGLRGELSGMVDTHEGSARAAVALGKWSGRLSVRRRHRSGGLGRRQNRTQGAVKRGDA